MDEEAEHKAVVDSILRRGQPASDKESPDSLVDGGDADSRVEAVLKNNVVEEEESKPRALRLDGCYRRSEGRLTCRSSTVV